MPAPPDPVALHTEFAPAKVNLTLTVRGRRADGYHLLDSLVAFASVGDVLQFFPSAAFDLEIAGPFAAALSNDESNLVTRAVRALSRHWPDTLAPARILLHKTLPPAAGLGGGSADAAAALRGMLRLSGIRAFAVHDRLLPIAASLGADVPMCLQSRPCRALGIGEDLTWPEQFAPLDAVLATPDQQVATGAVFARLEPEAPGSALKPIAPLPDTASPERIIAHAKARGNDLLEPARKLCPAIDDALALLNAAPDVALAGLSGSGATCFGLFATAAAAAHAAAQIAASRPNWWVRPCRLGQTGETDQPQE